MEQKIFLEKNRSAFSNDVESGINVLLPTKSRLLPNESIAETFSLNSQYNKERDESSKYRLIFTVNPICTNVLFNMKTEIVKNEGSDDCFVIRDDIKNKAVYNKDTYARNAVNTKDITYQHAMDDTEYSATDGFVYHCGANIFNNHMIRSINFTHVNKVNNSKEKETFNTINDYLRDGRGEIIKEDISRECGKSKLTPLHLYTADNISSMRESFVDKCKEKDGWWGFTNPGNIDIPNGGSNKMLGGNKPCEFIDLYPDRSLFSFIPKYNKHRQRIENNWDYCITYPYAKDFEKINAICGGEEQAIAVTTMIKTNSSGIKVLECSSYFKHTLKSGDYISLYYYNSSSEWQKSSKKIKIVAIGDANGMKKDKIFTIKYEDISDIYNYFQKGCFYKKISNGEECNYYFRIFKKIGELKSDINKVAFAENIYGDDLAQIIFTDTVDVDGLIDDNGRPISEVYLTVIKRNAGHNKWYGHESGNTHNTKDIEFSHCFGEVTSGLEFGDITSEPFDYNIHYLHNIEGNSHLKTVAQFWNTLSAWGDTIMTKPKVLENNITIDNEEFYGDIIEFDSTTYSETTIANVYHRVNTAQREVFDDDYRDIWQDTITRDDYDIAYVNNNGNTVTPQGFETKTYYLNDGINNTNEMKRTSGGNAKNLFYGNISPEGYYYNPHTKINLRSVSEVETTSPAKLINYAQFGISGTTYSGLTVEITAPINYGFICGDYIAFYDKTTKEIYWSEITKTSGTVVTVKFEPNTIGKDTYFDKDFFNPESESRRYYAFWSPNSVPLYAKLSLKVMKFVWRQLVAPSSMIRDDALYDTPFANGCFYIHKNVNFFLKRQDPYGKYGLSRPIFKKTEMILSNQMQKFVIRNITPFDISDVYYMIDNSNTCY